MTFEEFSAANRVRCESPQGFDHALDSWSESDWMTAVAGELGEAANVVKKLNRIRDRVRGNKETRMELQEKLSRELADTVIYLDLMFQRIGASMGECVRNVFNAKSTEIGYPEKLKMSDRDIRRGKDLPSWFTSAERHAFDRLRQKRHAGWYLDLDTRTVQDRGGSIYKDLVVYLRYLYATDPAMLNDNAVGGDHEPPADGEATSPSPYLADALPLLAMSAVAAVLKNNAEEYEIGNRGSITVQEHLYKAMHRVAAYLDGDIAGDHLEHAACRILLALDAKVASAARDA